MSTQQQIIVSTNQHREQRAGYQTMLRGDNDSEYQIYLACADNGKGMDITNGKPLKTFEEWVDS